MADREAERAALLEKLRREREERRQHELQSLADGGVPTDADPAAAETEAWERRRAERNALVQRLLNERQSTPTGTSTGTRTAWEDRLEKHTSRIEAELGLSSPGRSKPSSPARPTSSRPSAAATMPDGTLKSDYLKQLGADKTINYKEVR